MSSWLSNLEKRKQEEEERKHRQEQAERVGQEQKRLRGQQLKQLYESQYKNQIDAICESVNQLVSRAKAVGLGVDGWGTVDLTEDVYGTSSLRIAVIAGASWSRTIEAFFEENGKIKISYSWHVSGGEKKKDFLTVSIQAVDSSLIEDWIKWAATGEREGRLSRAWRRLRHRG